MLSMGDIRGGRGVPIRVHDQCMTSELFHSEKCDCRDQLEVAQRFIGQTGLGAIIYLQQVSLAADTPRSLREVNAKS